MNEEFEIDFTGVATSAHLKVGDGNGDRLAITMADADLDRFDAGFLGGRGGVTV